MSDITRGTPQKDWLGIPIPTQKYKTAEEMQREDIEKDRNSADGMLDTTIEERDNHDYTMAGISALMAATHAVLALKGEVQRIGDILDERMPTL